MHLKWSNDYLWFLILLIPLILMGWLMLRAFNKEKARDRRLAEEYSNYSEWKRLNDRWGIFIWAPVTFFWIADELASAYPVLRPVFGPVTYLLFFAWAPAVICAMVLWSSRYRDWKTYLGAIWRPVMIGMLLILVYWRIHGLADGLHTAPRLALIVLGAGLSPLFLRLSSFFKLDEFQLEPAPKSGIVGPHGEEM